MAERRKHKRVVFYAEADYGYQGKISDISADGAFIDTLTPLPVKSPISLKFTLPGGKKLTLKAVVTNTMHNIGMGVEFLNMKDEDKNALLDLIKKSE